MSVGERLLQFSYSFFVENEALLKVLPLELEIRTLYGGSEFGEKMR